MSTWKIAGKVANRPETAVVRGGEESSRHTAGPVDVVALEIDAEPNDGFDPYNSTGRYCIPEFDKRDE